MRYFYIFLFILFTWQNSQACSIFYANDNSNILAGKNVDWKVPASQAQFYPPTVNSYGYVNFCIKGYLNNSYGDNGGINDQGLFYEWADNGLPIDLNFHVKGTVDYSGSVLRKMLSECATVEEAEKLFRIYNIPGFSYAHLLIGDSLGNSVVIERAESDSLNFIRSKKNYQIATNFLNSYLNDPKTVAFIDCYRYSYIDEMLGNNSKISVELFRIILDGATNKGQQYPTIFSTIFDLKNLNIIFYRCCNYDEELQFSLPEELKKGRRDVLMFDLFSNIKGIYPISNELITNSSVDLAWYGDADEYEILVSQSNDFSGAISIKIERVKYQVAGLPYLSVLILILLLPLIRKNKRLLVAGIFILCIAGCEKDLVNLSDTVSTIKHSKTVEGLVPNKMYYWKIIASGKDGYKTESKVYNFTTSVFQ
jgi:hypothetical protein